MIVITFYDIRVAFYSNMEIMQKIKHLIFNPIIVDDYDFLFCCSTIFQASDALAARQNILLVDGAR